MDSLSNLFNEHLAQTTPYPIGIKVERAEGSYIYDQNQKAYLDLISGIGVSALGHGHPRIKDAIKKQLDKHLHIMVYGEFEQAAQNELAQELLKTLPSHLDSFYFLNSGTEANEAAMKLAKRISGRSEFVSFNGAYHGSTQGSLSISSNPERKNAFSPLLPDISFIDLNNTKQLDQITSNTAAVILESIQGDAGVRIPDPEYLIALRNKCDETGAFLILDEIQCGMGRTGKHWAFQHFEILPDMVTAGKALGAGMPIGCLMANQKQLKQFSHSPSLGHITTFGGHPLVCAAAAEGLKIIEEEKLLQSINQKAQQFKQLLKHKEIVEFRQMGLMMAIELENADKVEQMVLKGLEEGILLFWFLSTPNAFRLAPPLNISEKDIDKGCRTILNLLDNLT